MIKQITNNFNYINKLKRKIVKIYPFLENVNLLKLLKYKINNNLSDTEHLLT